MFTSNFAKNSNNPDAVSISAGKPKWFKGKTYPDLYPPWDIVKRYKAGEIDNKIYTKIYNKEVLRKLYPHEVYEDLGPNAVLLCWCGVDAFCHRKLVAKWLRLAGYDIEELVDKRM